MPRVATVRSKLTVTHLAQSDREGGANRAAFRLHKALQDIGVDSTFHAGRKLSSDASVVPAAPRGLGLPASRIVAYLNARALKPYKFRSGPFSPVKWSYGRLSRGLLSSSDVVCLHWIAGAFLRPADLATIDRPLVWRLSDLWPFTGGCHFPGSCRRFEEACGQCPVLGSTDSDDLSRSGYRAREKAYASLDLTVVAPSLWIADQARRSSLFHRRRIELIPTGVDLTVFRPHDRAAARDAFGLPKEGNILLFGAFAAFDDPRKGYDDLKAALHLLAALGKLRDVTVVVFGGQPDTSTADLPLPTRHLGRIDDESRLARLYSAADALVAPSKEDNLPNVALEALACGTPVVAFDVGGIGDAVKHDITGYLGRPGDREDLARGIEHVLTPAGTPGRMRRAARAHAEAQFDLVGCAKSYQALFEEVVRQHRPELDKIDRQRLP